MNRNPSTGMAQVNTTGHAKNAKLRPEPPRWLTLFAAALLLTLFAALSIWEMADDSVTIDELVYLPAGYSYWMTRDFSLNPEHPPLVKLLATAPLLAMNLKMPADQTAPAATKPGESAAAARQMNFGSRFLYSQDLDRIMFWGRLPMVALGVVLGLLIFQWSWELHGHPGAGLLSLFLFTLDPTLLAHSHYVTTDVAPACFSVMAMYFLWRFSRDGTVHNLALASVGLGLALAAKYSAVFLVPAFFPLLLVYWPSRRLSSSFLQILHPVAARFLALLGSVLLAAIAVQASYLFSPDLYLYYKGLRAVNINELAPSVLSYVHGAFIPGGAWWYHLYVFLLKTPIPTLFAFGLAAVPIVKQRKRSLGGSAFVWVPAAILLLAVCAFANNLGARYLIPVTVFILVLAGRSWFIFTQGWKTLVGGAVLAVWLSASVLFTAPYFIAYFNEIVGGPAQGPYYLDDSNVDWGQDLKRLASYLRENQIKELVLSYWGPTPPAYYFDRYGISYKPWTYEMASDPNSSPGVYAISVNQLVGIQREQLWLNRPLNPNLDWLRRFQPSHRIGYSIYIYKFPQTAAR